MLHTNEGVGPHTQTTLHYIQELKKKHGIDYDSMRATGSWNNSIVVFLRDKVEKGGFRARK